MRALGWFMVVAMVGGCGDGGGSAVSKECQRFCDLNLQCDTSEHGLSDSEYRIACEELGCDSEIGDLTTCGTATTCDGLRACRGQATNLEAGYFDIQGICVHLFSHVCYCTGVCSGVLDESQTCQDCVVGGTTAACGYTAAASEIRASLVAGRIKTDPVAAAACNSALTAAVTQGETPQGEACVNAVVAAAEEDICLRAVQSQVAVGGYCTIGFDCSGNATCNANTCTAVAE